MKSVSCEGPIEGMGTAAIIMSHAGTHVRRKLRRAFPHAVSQIRTAEYRQRDLSLVQPRGILRRVVKTHAAAMRLQPVARMSRSVRRVIIQNVMHTPRAGQSRKVRIECPRECLAILALRRAAEEFARCHAMNHHEPCGSIALLDAPRGIAPAAYALGHIPQAGSDVTEFVRAGTGEEGVEGVGWRVVTGFDPVSQKKVDSKRDGLGLTCVSVRSSRGN